MTVKWQCFRLKFKNKNCQIKYKKTAPLCLLSEGQMHQNKSVCCHIQAIFL